MATEVIREEPVRERVVERDGEPRSNGAWVAAVILIALVIVLLLWRPWHSNGSNGGTVNVSPTQSQTTPSNNTPSSSGTQTPTSTSSGSTSSGTTGQ